MKFLRKALYYGLITPAKKVINFVSKFFNETAVGKRIKNAYHWSYNAANVNTTSRYISRMLFAASLGVIAVTTSWYLAVAALFTGYLFYSSSSPLTGLGRWLIDYFEMGIGLYALMTLVFITEAAVIGWAAPLYIALFAFCWIFLKEIRREVVSVLIDAEDALALKQQIHKHEEVQREAAVFN